MTARAQKSLSGHSKSPNTAISNDSISKPKLIVQGLYSPSATPNITANQTNLPTFGPEPSVSMRNANESPNGPKFRADEPTTDTFGKTASLQRPFSKTTLHDDTNAFGPESSAGERTAIAEKPEHIQFPSPISTLPEDARKAGPESSDEERIKVLNVQLLSPQSTLASNASNTLPDVGFPESPAGERTTEPSASPLDTFGLVPNGGSPEILAGMRRPSNNLNRDNVGSVDLFQGSLTEVMKKSEKNCEEDYPAGFLAHDDVTKESICCDCQDVENLAIFMANLRIVDVDDDVTMLGCDEDVTMHAEDLDSDATMEIDMIIDDECEGSQNFQSGNCIQDVFMQEDSCVSMYYKIVQSESGKQMVGSDDEASEFLNNCLEELGTLKKAEVRPEVCHSNFLAIDEDSESNAWHRRNYSYDDVSMGDNDSDHSSESEGEVDEVDEFGEISFLERSIKSESEDGRSDSSSSGSEEEETVDEGLAGQGAFPVVATEENDQLEDYSENSGIAAYLKRRNRVPVYQAGQDAPPVAATEKVDQLEDYSENSGIAAYLKRRNRVPVYK